MASLKLNLLHVSTSAHLHQNLYTRFLVPIYTIKVAIQRRLSSKSFRGVRRVPIMSVKARASKRVCSLVKKLYSRCNMESICANNRRAILNEQVGINSMDIAKLSCGN